MYQRWALKMRAIWCYENQNRDLGKTLRLSRRQQVKRRGESFYTEESPGKFPWREGPAEYMSNSDIFEKNPNTIHS